MPFATAIAGGYAVRDDGGFAAPELVTITGSAPVPPNRTSWRITAYNASATVPALMDAWIICADKTPPNG